MIVSDKWKDYEILGLANGEKLERWGDVFLVRPDPQIIWDAGKSDRRWKSADAYYHRSKEGGGNWDFKKKLPERWTIAYKNLKFYVSPTGFKHTGIFPEQAVNWDFAMDKIKNANREISVLNLFAYTGGATLACASQGAKVCHVDAAKGMVNWAKENAKLSGLDKKPIRYIVDDCLKFVQREQRRGSKYDVIIMDPPSYGRGPKGEIWKIEDTLYELVNECEKILSDEPLFFLINSYTTGFSPVVLSNILKLSIQNKYGFGKVSSGEIAIPVSNEGTFLPCGIYGRWEA